MQQYVLGNKAPTRGYVNAQVILMYFFRRV